MKPQIPSITLFREPTARLLSAFFYRGHSPNLDFFQVRPYFKDIQLGKLPRVEFPEYIEMIEYQNIQTRMFGADSFPYRNITIDDTIYEKAVEAIEHMFFIGLQEEYEVSVHLLLREMRVSIPVNIQRERDQQVNRRVTEQKKAIKANQELIRRVREVNMYDIHLYELGKTFLLNSSSSSFFFQLTVVDLLLLMTIISISKTEIL